MRAFRAVMRDVVDRARGLFLEGLPLARMVDRRLSLDLDLFSRGGLRVLDKIERQDYHVLHRRPAIGKVERVRLLSRALVAGGIHAGRMTPRRALVRALPPRSAHAGAKLLLLVPPALEAAARRHVRDLRLHALLRRPERRARTATPHDAWSAGAPNWMRRSAGQFRRESLLAGVSRCGAAVQDPASLFPRHDRRRHFGPGAARHPDLRRALSVLLPGRLRRRTDDHAHLRIRVAAGAALAEKCGIAFQFTNIIRDVKEDQEKGRIYLPKEDRDRVSRTEDLLAFEAAGRGSTTQSRGRCSTWCIRAAAVACGR